MGETIQKLIEADIRVWVLTGDKQETAIEIGKSCSLIAPSMKVAILSSNNQSELLEKMENEITERVRIWK